MNGSYQIGLGVSGNAAVYLEFLEFRDRTRGIIGKAIEQMTHQDIKGDFLTLFEYHMPLLS